MMFDPFGDFESRGYLRNKAGLREPAAVRAFKHAAFLDKFEDALGYLAQIDVITYDGVLTTHRILFEDVYPWAGQDRTETAPGVAIRKGSVVFAHSNDARVGIMYALRVGQDRSFMAKKPGEIIGYFTYAHPFLDGNGPTMMTVHAELAQRAGISLDWAAIDMDDYSTALTRELERPGMGLLDAYLKPFTQPALGHNLRAGLVMRATGFDGISNKWTMTH